MRQNTTRRAIAMDRFRGDRRRPARWTLCALRSRVARTAPRKPLNRQHPAPANTRQNDERPPVWGGETPADRRPRHMWHSNSYVTPCNRVVCRQNQ